MENQNPKIEVMKDDEVDLLALAVKAYLLIKKRIFALIILIIAGLGITFIFRLLNTPTYTSKMTIESRLIGYAGISSLIETLQELIEGDDNELLAKKLNIPLTTAEKIRKLSTENILKRDAVQKEDIEYNRLFLEAQVKDAQIFPELQKGIIYYLENTEYFKKRVEDERQSLQLKIKKVNTEIQQLDSLKSSIKSLLINPRGQAIYLSDMGDAFKQSVDLYEKELEYQTDMKFSSQIQLIEGFTLFSKPTNFSLSKSLPISLGISFLIWLFWIIILEFRLVINRYTQEKSR